MLLCTPTSSWKWFDVSVFPYQSKTMDGVLLLTRAKCAFPSIQNIEEEGLRLLSKFPAVISSPFEVRTPKLYHFNPQASTQVQEYLPNATNLKAYAIANFQGLTTASTKPQCLQLGQSLGRWLREFHSWSDQPDNQSLHKLFATNTAMRNIKKAINYDQLLGRLSVFPAILQEHKETLQQIVAMATAELGDESKLSVIHGDFWTGK